MGNVYVFSFRGTHDTSHNFVTLSSGYFHGFTRKHRKEKTYIEG